MIKKITTEKDLNHHNFKLKVGTMDKKKADVIYVEGGTYIKPLEEKKSYSDDIHLIKKSYRDIIRKLTYDNEIFTSDYICTIDIPIDYTLKQKNNLECYDLVKEYGHSFIDKILDEIEIIIDNYNFSLSKSKK